MHFHDAMISLLSHRGDFRRKLGLAMEAEPIVFGRSGGWMALQRLIRRICEPFEPAARDLIREALQKLRSRAGAEGVPEQADGVELRAGADLVDMDWGKSELNNTGYLTLRLVATHMTMPKDPVVVEHRLRIMA